MDAALQALDALLRRAQRSEAAQGLMRRRSLLRGAGAGELPAGAATADGPIGGDWCWEWCWGRGGEEAVPASGAGALPWSGATPGSPISALVDALSGSALGTRQPTTRRLAIVLLQRIAVVSQARQARRPGTAAGAAAAAAAAAGPRRALMCGAATHGTLRPPMRRRAAASASCWLW